MVIVYLHHHKLDKHVSFIALSSFDFGVREPAAATAVASVGVSDTSAPLPTRGVPLLGQSCATAVTAFP
jgi:hypothetical protein